VSALAALEARGRGARPDDTLWRAAVWRSILESWIICSKSVMLDELMDLCNGLDLTSSILAKSNTLYEYFSSLFTENHGAHMFLSHNSLYDANGEKR
jgi:hypothetical protein